MKPLIFFLVFFTLSLFGTAVCADNVNIEPIKMKSEELTEKELSDISDGDYLTFYSADTLKLTLIPEESVQAVYIIWNKPPEDYTVYSDTETVTVDSGFMHGLATFSSSVESVTIDNPLGGEICDIYLFRDLNLPDYVQKWEPPCKQADMLVFSAHADDEFLMFGGTIPYYAKERDLRLQVVYMTTHWQEQPRPHELLDGLWAAGVENYPVIGIIPDIPYQPIFTLSEAAQLYDFDEVLEWFTEQIRRFKPSVIVTHDIKGEYGHAAHKLAAKTAADAVEISFDHEIYPESAEKYGVWDVPKTYLHFYGENAVEMDWEMTLESFGGITAREAAALCYDKHKSQHIWGYSVNYGDKWDCRQFGLYRSLVGNDTVADFMENIIPLMEEEPKTEAVEETEGAEEIETSEETEKISEAESTAPTETVSDSLNANSEITAPEADTNQRYGRLDYGIILVFAIIIAIVTIIVIIIKRKR